MFVTSQQLHFLLPLSLQDDGFVHFFEQQRDDAWLRDLLVMIAGIGLTATLAYRFVATR